METQCSLNCISEMIGEEEHIFYMCVLAICVCVLRTVCSGFG